jgi:uncharacterized tellurite resistance protein B-like protein
MMTERDLNGREAIWVGRAMAKVSACDGVVASEQELIEEFLKDVGSTKTVEELIEEEFDVKRAAKELDEEVRGILIESCWMVALADGMVSEKEKRLIAAYAEALGVADPKALRERVIDHLMQGLSHVKNTDALVEVSTKLRK